MKVERAVFNKNFFFLGKKNSGDFFLRNSEQSQSLIKSPTLISIC